MPEQYAAGETIASYCAKCKSSLDHTIMTMDDETIAKVQCKICGSMHKFKPAADAKKARLPRAKKRQEVLPSVAALWETSMSEAKGKESRYSMVAKYRVGDIVIHEQFGKGVVLKLRVHKCDVLFQDKERLMVSAN